MIEKFIWGKNDFEEMKFWFKGMGIERDKGVIIVGGLLGFVK